MLKYLKASHKPFNFFIHFINFITRKIPSRKAFAHFLLETVFLESGLSSLWKP